MRDRIITRFAFLFGGRQDVYGGWDGYQKKEQVDFDTFARHLSSDGPHIGIYPSVADTAFWGCIDIDGKDFDIGRMMECDNCGEVEEHTCHLDGEEYGPWWQELYDFDTMFVLARNLQTVLDVQSVSAHIERSRNGFHVWVFPEQRPILASTMRRALMAACAALDYNPNEVNPKQEIVGDDQRVKYGNYVRLPYPGAAIGPPGLPDNFVVPQYRYMVDINQHPIDLESWLDEAEESLARTEDLEYLASLWTPPAPSVRIDDTKGLHAPNLVDMLSGMAYTIWRDGPLPGGDRSKALAKLAHKCYDSKFTPEATLVVLRSANERWGKWMEDGVLTEHGEKQLRRMVENAY